MPIDWFTVAAQTLNFLILVWLMKRFLYQPILHAIDAREGRIAAELNEAAAKKAEAKQERDEFQHKNEEFDRERARRLAEVANEAKDERHRLFEEARREADILSAKWKDSADNHAQSQGKTIIAGIQSEVFSIARKALADLASASLEDTLCEVFTRRLRELDGQAKDDMTKALASGGGDAVVQSAYELSDEQRDAIQSGIDETFSTAVPLRFEIEPLLIGGIELSNSGHKMAWSISDYLKSLEITVSELFNREDMAGR